MNNLLNPTYWVVLLTPLLLSKLLTFGRSMIRSDIEDETNTNSGIARSPFTPPSWVFQLVWTVLYLILGHVLYMVLSTNNPGRYWFYLSLALNFIWIINSSLNTTTTTLYWSWLLIVGMILTLLIFFVSSNQPGLNGLLVPYLMWLGFAFYLSYFMYRFSKI